MVVRRKRHLLYVCMANSYSAPIVLHFIILACFNITSGSPILRRRERSATTTVDLSVG